MAGLAAAFALAASGTDTSAAFGPGVLLAQVGAEAEARLPVHRVVLDNGMTVLALPRRGAPIVSLVVRYGVGGVHEKLGTTGAAHLLEHMLFKGTETVGARDRGAETAIFPVIDAVHDSILATRTTGDPREGDRLRMRLRELEDSARVFGDSGEFDRILRRAGARGLNATTTSEATTYFVELPSNRLEEWFRLEADRMASPVFREFYTERDVVMEERRMRVDSDPGGALAEAHFAVAFTVHPYGQPVVGHMFDLETLSREAVAAYHQAYYVPNNAVVVVVGDIRPSHVEQLARRHFGPLPRGSEPPALFAVEPEQRGERRVELVWDAQPRLRVGWKVPSGIHPDAPALDVTVNLLTGGRTSRLYRRLVLSDRLATAVYSSMGPGSAYPRLLVVEATPLAPNTPRQIEAAIYEEVRRLAEEGPLESELARVHNQAKAGAVRRLQSNLGLALQLAEFEAKPGGWREILQRADRLGSVTIDQVKRVVSRYLIRERRTVATLSQRQGG